MLNPAATLEFDFLRQIRFVYLGTLDHHPTHLHTVLYTTGDAWLLFAAFVIFDVPTPSVLDFIHCRFPCIRTPLTLSPASTLEFDFLHQMRFVDLGTPDPHTRRLHGCCHHGQCCLRIGEHRACGMWPCPLCALCNARFEKTRLGCEPTLTHVSRIMCANRIASCIVAQCKMQVQGAGRKTTNHPYSTCCKP